MKMKAPSAACASADGAFVVTKDKKEPRTKSGPGQQSRLQTGATGTGNDFQNGFRGLCAPKRLEAYPKARAGFEKIIRREARSAS